MKRSAGYKQALKSFVMCVPTPRKCSEKYWKKTTTQIKP